MKKIRFINEEFISMCKEISSHNVERVRQTICVSGGFDPVHVGHIRMFNAANEIGDVIVIVNSDNFLKKKKGKPFMELKERIEIIKNIKAVSAVVPCIDRDMTVRKTLELIKPDIFANGGDRNKKNIPEVEVCNKLGIKMLFGVGGRKIQSSSKLINGI